jgi:hypothetical protein
MNTLIILDFATTSVLFVSVTEEQTQIIEKEYDNDVEAWVVECLEAQIEVDMTNCQYMFVDGEPKIFNHAPIVNKALS